VHDLAASRTALATSLMRAIHTRLDPQPLIDDPWGDRLVPDAVRAAIRESALAAMDAAARARALAAPGTIVDAALRASAAYGNVITRARYTEDALRTAVANGIRQYVIVGAGFDSFALRRPAFARDVTLFEIDHPATQDLKRRRLAECGVAVEGPVHYIGADLAHEDLAAVLARSPLRPQQPAFFSWLGVTMYLTPEANLATLRAIAGSAAPASALVFTYLDLKIFAGDRAPRAFRALREAVAAAGEPFRSGFDPATIAADLRAIGFVLLEDLDGEQLTRRVDGADANALRTSRASHIAHARVAG
jgi:methyltransferase (TIGR00027 family)